MANSVRSPPSLPLCWVTPMVTLSPKHRIFLKGKSSGICMRRPALTNAAAAAAAVDVDVDVDADVDAETVTASVSGATGERSPPQPTLMKIPRSSPPVPVVLVLIIESAPITPC